MEYDSNGGFHDQLAPLDTPAIRLVTVAGGVRGRADAGGRLHGQDRSHARTVGARLSETRRSAENRAECRRHPLDDVGFAATSTFGGLARTPNLDKLASDGLRYNRFNTTAICSPTRAALLTGRNHHQVGFGNLQDIPAGFPAYNTIWKKETASIARILHDNGYSTAAFGKWHNTPQWEISPAGPFDRWPTGLGFDRFYGFLNGEDNQWEPHLYDNTTPVESPDKGLANYHLTSDLVDHALQWVDEHDALAAKKPYFLYFATGAAHQPFHVPAEWIARNKGRFDGGWDRYREMRSSGRSGWAGSRPTPG